jgi:hypothetical protein
MKRIVLLLIISVGMARAGHCQRINKPNQQEHRVLLMLLKKNSNKNAYYSKGDVLSFQLGGEKLKRIGEIIDFSDSTIFFRGYEINLSEIKCLYIDDKTKWWLRFKIAQLSLLSGSTYFLVDLLNSGQINQATVMVSATLISVGLVSRLIIGNKIRIRGKTKLRIIRI